MQTPKINGKPITIVTEYDAVVLLQIAVNHLAMSIDDGSFDLKGANEEGVMSNLYELNCHFENILDDFS